MWRHYKTFKATKIVEQNIDIKNKTTVGYGKILQTTKENMNLEKEMQ